MKRLFRPLTSLLLVLTVLLSVFTVYGTAASEITTNATGYKKASDVKYVTVGKYIANWGARGEDATFLSKYALDFYKGNNSYDKLSSYSGGSSQSNAQNSVLYSQLKSLMKSAHSHETSYGETRDQYKYTDCVSNNYSNISSFYSGKVLSGAWDGGSTWNREHTWPNSKGLAGNDENDIMMLRPTSVSENSSRGNTAYGESSGYYDPGASTRGDVARIVLYVYVRWGNTSRMWGKSGVMESMDVLLRWMEEDPVDTWEMGRNDAVEAITGTRNVFVDYPELAWKLFGKSVPKNMTTPSGNAAGGNVGGGDDIGGGDTPACTHKNTELRGVVKETCGDEGYTGDTYCVDCGAKVNSGFKTYATEDHKYGEMDASGYSTCTGCGKRIHVAVECKHTETEVRGELVSCTGFGYSGDVHCKACGELIEEGTPVPAVSHDWQSVTDTLEACSICGEARRKPDNTGATVAIVGGSVGGVSAIAVVLFFILKRRPI